MIGLIRPIVDAAAEEFPALAGRFDYHPATTIERRNDHDMVRLGAKQFATVVSTYCPEGRELSLALTKIEEAMMFANAAIARQKDEAAK
ncbi:hypothetical protein HOT75_gp066 [Gordonia phage Daredevil]|uniref:Acb2/Tad1 hairpin domain-containing protein n=1 Tax=Gordonia phage Daredevil TaxID=2283286 RepID=A0A345MIS2_9CAUD|nr:hypothetical protein HOT75_gp066 [Gordonia phage Daredevil]AXH70453.1 hypothetical protein SEA_DAREDEVIL_66 [Gordonia phage Daredevil]